MSKLARVFLWFANVEDDRASRTFVHQLHLIGAEVADLVQFGQRGKAKPVIVYRRLIRLEHLLNVLRQRQSEVAHHIYILLSAAPSNARAETVFVADGGTASVSVI